MGLVVLVGAIVVALVALALPGSLAESYRRAVCSVASATGQAGQGCDASDPPDAPRPAAGGSLDPATGSDGNQTGERGQSNSIGGGQGSDGGGPAGSSAADSSGGGSGSSSGGADGGSGDGGGNPVGDFFGAVGDGLSTAASATGHFFKGAGEQLWDGAKGAWNGVKTLGCTVHICSHEKFKQTWGGYGKLITDPAGSAKAIWDSATKGIREDWNNGNEAEAAGRVPVAVLTTIFGGKGIGKLGKLSGKGDGGNTPDGSGRAGSNPDKPDADPDGGHLKAAADDSVDVSDITPAPVWRTDTDTLYRADGRPPEVVFGEGFHPKSPDGTNLRDYVETNQPSAFVSTSRTPDIVDQGFGGSGDGTSYRYVVEAPGGIDVSKTLSNEPFPDEQEVAFPGGIEPRYIKGVQACKNGKCGDLIENPNFQPKG